MTFLLHLRSPQLIAGLFVAVAAILIGQLAGAQETPKNFVMHAERKPVAAISFVDSEGQTRSLADFKNKVVLLNIWATWCVPCRREMPALDRLQTVLGGAGFEVVPLSIDRGGIDVVRKFFAEVGIQKLAMYLDNSGKATRELGALGLPTTLLIDRKGREIGRLVGPAEWDSPEIVEFIRRVISKDNAAQSLTAPKSAAAPSTGKRSLNVPADAPVATINHEGELS